MRRALALAGLIAVAAGAGMISISRARDQLAVIEACDAAHSGDHARALALTDGRTGDSETGRAAAECRCDALIGSGDTAGCVALLDALVQPPGDWTPRPELAALLVRAHSERGRGADAAALARAVAREHPEDPSLLRLELEMRAAVEPEEQVLRDLAARVPARGDAAALMRTALGQRHLLRGDAPAALRALGDQLPDGAGAARALWFDTVGIAHAMNDDLASARASYARWQQAGGHPQEVRARYALALSISGLSDPELDLIAALREGLADAAARGDAALEETLAVRLIFTLVASARSGEALAAYDALSRRVALKGITREEIERARHGREIARARGAAGAGRIRFALDASAGGPAYAAGTLWLSPDAGAAPDTDYEPRPLASGDAVEVARSAGIAPQRWVWRPRDGGSAASGTVYARAGELRQVAIRPGAAAAPPPPPARERKPGDGRRRVAFVLLDCGDWAISQYLRTRGDLPVLDALLHSGYRAVLDSDPPLTAAALEALVWPERRTDASLVGTFYRFGVELAGLESVGSNPFELLSWVLPETRDLFGAIGEGPRSAANLLLAHGGVRAGRHGDVTGPHGATRRIALGAARRALDAGERARFPRLANADDAIDAHYIQTIAAEFDTIDALLRAGEIDLVAIRIEPLDILTHKHFSAAVREAQDDGAGLLFDVYRYIDARIGALHRFLDADDVLIVLSDHGIRTALEHDRPALFVATGAGVPAGRAPGNPSLRGVSRVVADLLGVETAWPDTGIASWARAVAASGDGAR